MEFKYKSGHVFPATGMKTGISLCGKRLISYTFFSDPKTSVTCEDCMKKKINGVEVKHVPQKVHPSPSKKNSLEIAECPFCNHNKAKCLSMKRDSSANPGRNYQVVCNKCKARGPLVPDSEEKAIDLWNRTF